MFERLRKFFGGESGDLCPHGNRKNECRTCNESSVIDSLKELMELEEEKEKAEAARAAAEQTRQEQEERDRLALERAKKEINLAERRPDKKDLN